MGDDDEVIVVVVGDEDENLNESKNEEISENGVSIKVEALDDENEASPTEMGVEELMATVEKHGEVVDIDLKEIVKAEPAFLVGEEVEYIDENLWDEYEEDPSTENYGSPITLPSKKYSRKYGSGNEVLRHKMLKPHERRSYVKQLKKQRPELKKNEKLLIDALEDVMRNTKPPPLPKGYCFFDKDGELQCSKCTHRSKTLAAMGRHYQEMHGERYLICLACGVDFRSKTNLYKHEKRCTASEAVYVLKARALYVGRKARSRPFIPEYERPFKKKSYYKPDNLKCELCPATFSSKMALQAHLYLHNGLRPYKCPQCPAAYTSPTALSRHMAKHTAIEYICDHCNRSFKVKSALVVHMNTHKPEKRFGCAECPKRYAQKCALQLHVRRVHRNLPPPCACQICPRRYPRMSLLKAHMLKEHGMSILTRKMFLRYLPTMPDEEMVEQAKLIFKETESYDSGSEYATATNYVSFTQSPRPEKHYIIPDTDYEDMMNYRETEEKEYELKISQLPIKKEFNVDDKSDLTMDQAELLELLTSAQNNGAQDVKLFSVKNGNVDNRSDLTIDQAELLELLTSAQNNGAQDVKLFSVKNGKMLQLAVSADEHEVAFEEL